jgi:hypothetical protein
LFDRQRPQILGLRKYIAGVRNTQFGPNFSIKGEQAIFQLLKRRAMLFVVSRLLSFNLSPQAHGASKCVPGFLLGL